MEIKKKKKKIVEENIIKSEKEHEKNLEELKD